MLFIHFVFIPYRSLAYSCFPPKVTASQCICYGNKIFSCFILCFRF